jgi:Rab family protein
MSMNSEILNTYEDLGIELKYDHLYKIIIIGDTCVGKTAILSKYLKGVFPTSPLSTVATEFATKIIQIKEGGYIKAQIWDTAGQEKYKSITYHHYKKSVGGLIVYDITKRSSYDNVKNWYNDLMTLGEKGCIIALVGNKLDLIEKNKNKREVPLIEAQSYAEDNHMLFFETSAYNGNNINDIFEELLQTIYTERRKIPELKERDSLLENQNIINLRNQRDINANGNSNNSNNECEC